MSVLCVCVCVCVCVCECVHVCVCVCANMYQCKEQAWLGMVTHDASSGQCSAAEDGEVVLLLLKGCSTICICQDPNTLKQIPLYAISQ